MRFLGFAVVTSAALVLGACSTCQQKETVLNRALVLHGFDPNTPLDPAAGTTLLHVVVQQMPPPTPERE